MTKRLLLALLMLALPARADGPTVMVGFGAAGGGSGLSVGVKDCAQSGTTVSSQSTTGISITSGSTVVVGISYTTFGGGFQAIWMDGSPASGAVQVGSPQTGGGNEVRMYYIPNVSSGSHTFGVDVANDYATVCAVEIIGANTSDPFDVGSATTDSTEPYTGTGITTTVADAVLVAFFGRFETGANPSSPTESTFTLQDSEQNCTLVVCSDIWTRIVSSTGTYNVSSNDAGTDGGTAIHLAAIIE
jgi:hypothetical protein